MWSFTKICSGVYYVPDFVANPDASFQDVNKQVEFVHRSRKLYGKTVKTPRLEAWYGPRAYNFGGSTLPARKLPPIVASLAVRAEAALDSICVGSAHLDSCLVNLYRDGRDSVGWHADDEPEMGDPLIASVSLGAARDFMLRRKASRRPSMKAARLAGAPWAEPDNFKLSLGHGSLLIMLRGVQAEFDHCVPKRHGCLSPRVNLTFRQPE